MISHDRHVIAADGTRIAYGVAGDGPVLALTNGLTTSVFFWTHLYPRWIQRFTVITWDLKGHGDSEPARSAAGTTIPALADDLRRVLDDAGVDQAIHVGFSMGSQVIFELYRQAPERVLALVPLLGTYQRVLDTALGPLGKIAGAALRVTPRPLVQASGGLFRRLVRTSAAQGVGRRLKLIGPEVTPEDLDLYVQHFGRVHLPTIAAMTLAAQAHSAADLLPTITAPVLVIGGGEDVFAPADRVAVPMQRLIPGAERLHLERGTHTSLFEHPDAIDAAIVEFLERRALLPRERSSAGSGAPR
ncbi:MAG: alpha/beta hydrolase [Nannocystaceae bacterium]